MKAAVAVLAGLVVSAAALGCGSQRVRTGLPGLAANSVAANGIDSACGQITDASVVVLCPTWLPGGDNDPWAGGPVGGSGGCAYLVSILGGTASDTVPFHVMFGGRCHRFSLAQTPSGEWPRRPNFTNYLGLIGQAPRTAGGPTEPPPIRLKVVERTTVGNGAALMVRVPPYPDAGIQEGHYAIVWNHGQDGYELSFHYSPRGAEGLPPTPEEREALRASASEMRAR